MLLCKKIKIEISQQDAETLEFMQAKCRGLYNWWVMRLKNGERWNFEQAKRSLQESKQYDPELRSVYGKLLAEVFYRLDGAMQGFFRRVKAGEKPGFPRVKPRHQFFTLCYPAMYLDTIQGNAIILPTGGKGRNKTYPNIVAHLTENPPDHFHEVAVSRDARGNYYLSFVYDDEEQREDETRRIRRRQKKRQPRPLRDEGIVAFDLGIKTLATGYTDQGRFYHIGGFKGYRWYKEVFAYPPETVHRFGGICKNLQDRRMHTVSALENLLAILTPIGMRLLRLRDLARLAPDLPATQVVSTEVVQVVALLDRRPQAEWTIRDLCGAIARFGGFLARKCDGLPGWQTLWNGWVFVQNVLLGVHLAALLPPS